MLLAAPGKDKALWEQFVASLAGRLGHHRAITEVSIDMSPAYLAGVKENLGDQAVIVFDKFYVIAHPKAALDMTQRIEQRQRGKKEREVLKGARRALLKNPENHTPQQADCYAGLLPRNLASVKAHPMRRILQAIYEMKDTEVARRRLRAWCRGVRWVASKNLQPLFAAMVKQPTGWNGIWRESSPTG